MFQWCYIGSKTLTRSITLFQKTYPNAKHDTFHVTWHPYYLNPEQFSTGSVDKSELTKTRLASWSPEKVAAARNRVEQAGRSVGIEFSWGGKIGSTRLAHTLTHLAQTRIQEGQMGSVQVRDKLVEGIFRAFHTLEMDVSDAKVLRGIATDAGLDEDEVDKCFNSDEAGKNIDAEAAKNRNVTSAGVPYFIIQGEHIVDGAQDLQEFVEAFIKVRESEDAKVL